MREINTENFNLFSPKNERENIHLDLIRIKNAIKKLNNPCINIPAIQIIGTNGKGSITSFLENIICRTEIKIGVTTSPHLFDIKERIKVNKLKIKQDEFEKLLKKIQKDIKEFQLSPFEIIICCSLSFFDQQNVDLLLLEAGLGGRLDATTAHKLRPIIAIGNIGKDHTEYLGESIEEIAREKVAVIEKDSIVVSCNQLIKVEHIINERVKKTGAKMFWVNPLSQDWEIGLKGSFQRENAAVALKVIKILISIGWKIKNNDIKKGLAKTKWPGRLELINWNNKKILVDSAHNSSAARALSNERKNWLHQENGVYWIIGIQKQKNISSILKNLIKPIDTILLVPVPHQKSWTLKEILDIANFESEKIFEFNNFTDALIYIEKLNIWPDCHPVLTGSIFLVSEFIKFTRINS